MVVMDEDDYLAHYGILRESGRYPWGSGGNFGAGDNSTEFARSLTFQSTLAEMRSRTGKDALSDLDIAEMFGMTTTELRDTISIAKDTKKQARIFQASKLANTGMSPSAIGREMKLNESSVRDLLAPGAALKSERLSRLTDHLRQRVTEDKYIDIGKGMDHHLQVSKKTLDTAVAILKSEGYAVESVQQPQATTAHDTRVRTLASPGETWSSISQNKDKIKPAAIFSNDQGQTIEKIQEPLHLNPKRLQVVYKESGGSDRDGLILVRQGIKDLTMDGASYAQVRVQVGDGHFIKGMAVMKDGLPDGVDMQFHTSKSDTGNKLDALKPVKGDSEPLERFGAIYSQLTDPVTGKVRSHMNIVNDEEDWDQWSKSIATQMLSKQKPDFVKRQLDVTLAQKKAQLDEILTLTNPVVKKELLKSYADDMDASSIHLKAAALPRQKTHVILPVGSLKDNEVYAPGYTDGEKVVLIRYPHGGKFEIPELVVNTRNREARALIPAGSKAAIGINSTVAKVLSGADFDGDTVVLIPNQRGRIQKESPLLGLKNFEPQVEYRGSSGLDKDNKHIPLPGVRLMTTTQNEMGQISNLITDMTIAGADHSELTRAVKHSMVVIDAEKHGLNYRQSATDNGILALKKKYQPGRNHGASTIISRIGGEKRIPDLKLGRQSDGGSTNKVTGEAIYVPTGKTSDRRVKDPITGEITYEKVLKRMKVERGSRLPGVTVPDGKGGQVQLTDAHQLVGASGNPVERHYADYSNQVRQLANKARLVEVNTPDPRQNPSAKAVYKPQVDSLKAKVKLAQMNAPKERQAQAFAAVVIKMKREANPAMTPEQLKRTKVNALRVGRERMGAVPQRVVIEPKEWEAVQAGAVASNVLREVLSKADPKQVKQLAQPKNDLLIQPHDASLARSLLANGYTRAEVAKQLGVSVSTLDRGLK